MKIIGHIDADCFYVSAERVRDPRLIGKPVAVLSNQGACVIARSYEIRPFGVTVGMPTWDAKKICPEGIFIKRDFNWYGVLSKAMQEVLHKFSDVVEYYSIDESFVHFGDAEGDLMAFGKKIQKEMSMQTGVPVSVGLASSRILSKVASKKNKPFGVTVVENEYLEKFLKEVPIGDVPGIGKKLGERLIPIGIENAWDYVKTDHFLIKKIVHKPGEELWYELQGKSILPVRTVRPERKNISRGGSLWGKHSDPNYIWGFLVRNLERFVDALWRQQIEILNLVVVMMTSDGRFLKDSQSLPDYTSSYALLIKALRSAFNNLYRKGVLYSMSHLLGEPIRSVYGKQLSIFDVEGDKDFVMKNLKREINERFGLFAIRSAATAYASNVFKDEASHAEVSDIDAKFCF